MGMDTNYVLKMQTKHAYIHELAGKHPMRKQFENEAMKLPLISIFHYLHLFQFNNAKISSCQDLNHGLVERAHSFTNSGKLPPSEISNCVNPEEINLKIDKFCTIDLRLKH
jgi:hypothetical protein